MVWRAMILLIFMAAPALAETKVALVIGNAAYKFASTLANPINDSNAVATRLAALGFDVQLEQDLTGQAFRVALGQFSDKALHADLALVYYAGHGIEMGGQNYLIPVDSEMRSETTAQFETVSLDQVLTTVRGAGALGIVMLDACRDNPFANSMTRKSGTRAVSRGLAPVSVEGEGGLVVSFAAQAGSTADDGDNGHSPYAEAFIEVLDQPGLEVGRMFRTLRAKVREKSGGRQVPVEQAQLPDHDVFITPVSGTVPVVAPPVTPPVVPNPTPVYADPDAQFFEAVQSNDPEKLSRFAATYPDHPRASDARSLIASMQEEAMWKQVAADASEAALRRYLLVFPSGLHADEAAGRIAALHPAPVPAPAPVPTPAPTPTPTPQPQLSVAPTFDCGLARSDVEIAICSNGDLALQDHAIVAAYKAALARKRVSKSGQKAWVLNRDATCANMGSAVYQCVYQITAARIAELGG
jgi:uncharacterized protein YecT (DUF1311 family)